MGGCASKPKGLDSERAPAPVENPEKAEEKTTETKTEEPLVDLSEAPKPEVEEVKTEAVSVCEEADEPPEASTEDKVEELAAAEKINAEEEEKKLDEAQTRAPPRSGEAEVAAPKPEGN